MNAEIGLEGFVIPATALAVRFHATGEPEVLQADTVPVPEVGPGRVLVRVEATGTNPFDAKVMRGMPTASGVRVDLPSGIGSDFTGVVVDLGEGVDPALLGTAVIGNQGFGAHAEYVVADVARVFPRPEGLAPELAGALWVVTTTAVASVRSVGVEAGDTVLVSAAAGGVGVLVSQLCLARGARVIGTASPANAEFLSSLGVVPVDYRGDLVAAVREAADREGIAPVTAAIDNNGRATVLAALELGVAPQRINTIADYAAPAEFGIRSDGAAQGTAADVADVAAQLAAGTLTLPIDSTFPLTEASAAYTRLVTGHARGKVVLIP